MSEKEGKCPRVGEVWEVENIFIGRGTCLVYVADESDCQVIDSGGYHMDDDSHDREYSCRVHDFIRRIREAE